MGRPYGRDFDRRELWAFFEKLMLSYGGRPHWAKVWRRFPACHEGAAVLPTNRLPLEQALRGERDAFRRAIP